MRPGTASFDVCARQCLFSSRWIAGWKQEGAVEKRDESGKEVGGDGRSVGWTSGGKGWGFVSRISGLKAGTRKYNTKGRYAKRRALYAKGLLPPIHLPASLSFTRSVPPGIPSLFITTRLASCENACPGAPNGLFRKVPRQQIWLGNLSARGVINGGSGAKMRDERKEREGFRASLHIYRMHILQIADLFRSCAGKTPWTKLHPVFVSRRFRIL